MLEQLGRYVLSYRVSPRTAQLAFQGLFLGSGRALATGGPVGVFLGYLFTGILVSGVVISIAEMSALVPLSGSIIRQAEYFFDPALSFAQGWNTVYNYSVGIPAEIVAAGVLIEFWVPASEVSSMRFSGFDI